VYVNAKVSRSMSYFLHRKNLLIDGAGVVAPMRPARMVRGYATVMRVVALENHEAGAVIAFARPVQEAGSRVLEEGLHFVALEDAAIFPLARRCMHEKHGANFQIFNGGLPGGCGGAVLVISGGVHSQSVRKECITDFLKTICLVMLQKEENESYCTQYLAAPHTS
jgi:hypothetical protein